MRDALNNNTIVQIAVIAVLMVLAGLLFMTQMSSRDKGSSPPSTSAVATPSPTPAADPGSSTAPVPSAQPAQELAPLAAGPGLPKKVLSAYQQGKTIVLLVVRPAGIDDRLVREALGTVNGDSRVKVFVTRAKGIARYARITEGVGVSQVPALVVVSPRGVSGATPKATVSYGFRGGESVVQAVRDAVYEGRSVGYDPG